MQIGLGISLTMQRGGGGAASSLSAPALAVDAPVTNPPTFTATIDLPEVGDVIRLQLSLVADFSAVSDEATNTLDGAEVADGEALFALGTLAPGDYYARARHERGGDNSAWSSSATFTIEGRDWSSVNSFIIAGGSRQFATADAYILEAV